jgi:hypothetical protein
VSDHVDSARIEKKRRSKSMGVFSSIKDWIWGKAEAATPAVVATEAVAQPTPQPIDIDAILTAAAASAGYETNWRTSIVDLMKLCGLDSSLANRKELAAELGFTGDTNDSASMNIWLHRQVMNKLSENGGFVPADLKD